MLNRLEEYRKSKNVGYMKFLQNWRPNEKVIYAFFEGEEDARFYRRFIEKKASNKWEIEEINCESKHNVIENSKLLDFDRYDKNRICFFIDKDLSFWINGNIDYGSNVYITDGYSIENYLIDKNLFILLLKDCFGFKPKNKKEKEWLKDQFNRLIKNFSEDIKEYMAKAVIAKMKDYKTELGILKIKDHVTFKCDKHTITYKLNIKNIDDEWNIKPNDNEKIKNQIQQFNKYKNEYSVRGKWIINFMLELALYIRKNPKFFSSDIKYSNNEKLKCIMDVHSNNIVSIMSACSLNLRPKSIQSFIQENYKCIT